MLLSGCPVDRSSLKCMNPFRAFQGCMRLLTVNNQQIDLIVVQQRLLGNYSQLQIDMCGIIDRLETPKRFMQILSVTGHCMLPSKRLQHRLDLYANLVKSPCDDFVLFCIKGIKYVYCSTGELTGTRL